MIVFLATQRVHFEACLELHHHKNALQHVPSTNIQSPIISLSDSLGTAFAFSVYGIAYV